MSQQINLFNPALLRRKQHLSAVTMVQGMAVILVGAAALAGYAHVQTRTLTEQASSVSTRLGAAKAQLATVLAQNAPRERSKDLEAELQRLETEIVAQRKAFDIVRQGGVGDTKGYSAYLQAFSRQIVDGLWLTGFTIDSVGRRMELQGRALQPELVPAYIHRLGQEPAMQGRSFAQLMMSRPEVEMEAGTQKNDQGADGAAPGRRVPAKYLEFVLKSSGDAGGGQPGRDMGRDTSRNASRDAGRDPGTDISKEIGKNATQAKDLLQALPGLTPGGAAAPGKLPNLRDMAGAH